MIFCVADSVHIQFSRYGDAQNSRWGEHRKSGYGSASVISLRLHTADNLLYQTARLLAAVFYTRLFQYTRPRLHLKTKTFCLLWYQQF